MLQYIRDRAQGWFAWVIVILIIIPFALWGINQYFGGGKEAAAAKVNDTEISQQQLEMAYWQQRQRLQEMLGSAFRPELFPEEQLKRRVLDDLVRQELMVQAAGRAGLRVGDAHLAETIRGIDAFQVDGRFSPEAYERLLSAQGMQPGYFEQRVRRDLVAEQFSAGITETAFATEQQRQQYLRLSKQTRDLGYLTVPAEQYRDTVSVSDEDIQAYYEANAARFMQPEAVRIAYLELDRDRIASGIEVGEETLKQRYEAQKLNYATPEERRARHILIAVEAGAEESVEQAALKEAQGIAEQLNAGADFAAFAKEHSDDPGSAAQGGDLGFFGRGVMDPAFEEAVFSLQAGEISAPVRSAFGYHVIKLEEMRGGETKAFEEVREQLLSEVRREQADQVFYEQAEQLANLTYEHPDSLQPAAEQLGLSVQESDWFPRSGGEQGVIADSKVISVAFSEDVLAQGYNSEVIELTPTHLVVLRSLGHREAAQQPLDEVREDVVAAVRQEKAAEKARSVAADAVKAIEEGKEPQAVAGEIDGQWQRSEQLSRQAGLDQTIVEAAFAMPRPGEKPSVRQVALGGGDQAVLVLYGVNDGDPAAAPDTELKQLEQVLARSNGEAAFAGIMDAIRARSDIKMSQ